MFLDSILSLILLSSSLNFSASLTSLSISSLLSLPLSLVMTILLFLPVDFSTAVTLRIEFASRSYVISIWGCPLGIGGIPSKLNLPNKWLSLVNCLSPSYTWTKTPGWLSEYVENICVFLQGIVLFLGIKTVITPPTVSIPKDKGVTSSKISFSMFSSLTLVIIAAWTAAP